MELCLRQQFIVVVDDCVEVELLLEVLPGTATRLAPERATMTQEAESLKAYKLHVEQTINFVAEMLHRTTRVAYLLKMTVFIRHLLVAHAQLNFAQRLGKEPG